MQSISDESEIPSVELGMFSVVLTDFRNNRIWPEFSYHSRKNSYTKLRNLYKASGNLSLKAVMGFEGEKKRTDYGFHYHWNTHSLGNWVCSVSHARTGGEANRRGTTPCCRGANRDTTDTRFCPALHV
jgi:hypothetical protein